MVPIATGDSRTASNRGAAGGAPVKPGGRAACAGMPAEMGAGFWVRLARHDARRPEALRRWDVVSSDGECPADELPAHLAYAAPACVRVAPEAMRALFDALRAHRVAELRVVPMAPTPHPSEYELGLHWAGGECSLAVAAGDAELVREDGADFRAAVDAVIATANAAH